jgi:hypothetical protein
MTHPTLPFARCRILTVLMLALSAPLSASAATAATAPASSPQEDTTVQFKTVLDKRGNTAVPVKYVMSVSGAGREQQQEGQTQGTLVSADGLILVPGRVVSLDLGAFMHGSKGQGSSPSVKSGQFRVQLAGSDEWLPADLVTRDTELGIAWLRLRHPAGKLPYVDFGDPATVVGGTALFTVMRTSDQFGSVPIVRAGYVLGQTTVPRPTFLVDGVPGVAFDENGKPAGFVDVDLAAMMHSRASSGSIGMDFGDQVFSMTPAARIGRATAQAAVLPVVKSTDADEADAAPDAAPAAAPTAPKSKHGIRMPPLPGAEPAAPPIVPVPPEPPAQDPAHGGGDAGKH